MIEFKISYFFLMDNLFIEIILQVFIVTPRNFLLRKDDERVIIVQDNYGRETRIHKLRPFMNLIMFKEELRKFMK